MTVVDFHTHVWPDAIARQALGASVPEMPLCGDGTVSGLRAAQYDAGVDLSVCLAIANTPDRVDRVNAYAGSLDREHFVPFGSVHPGLSVADNLESLRRHGIRGVKLHPTFQQYRLDDSRLLALLGALAGEFPVVMHVGAGAGSDGTHATPAMVRDIIRSVPSLTLVACHFGGYHHMPEALDALVGEDIYLDTSWPPSVAQLDAGLVAEIVTRHGADRIVFASDWPTASPAVELAALDALGLQEDELTLIRGGNALRILRR